MLDFAKIVDLYLELSESAFFEDESDETVIIESELKQFFLQQVSNYDNLATLQKQVVCLDKAPFFTDLQIKALSLLADATLKDNSVKSEPDFEPELTPVVKKIVRGRPKKNNLESIKAVDKAIAKAPMEEDEYIDSEIPMRDPKTGQQMSDPKTGKPLFLRIKKNPVKNIIPPNYKAPPPPSMANAIAEQQAMNDLQKAQNFKIGGGFSLADLINKSKG